ncbi:MAG TPA: DUF4412 domain-containing protein [Daejeonella sp.]|nr:DUF4412 domain-containing protein [Daejeonella sp.]
MKKIILSIALLFTACMLYAQNGKINEGTVTYSVQWNLPANMQAMAATLPTELKVYFKGDSASMRSESQMFSSTNILNTKKEYERILLEIPMMKKKFSVILTPVDQEKIADQMPELTLKQSAETKKVAGYTAQKYEVNEKKSNQNLEAWFTKEVEITPNSLSRFYDKSYGFPVEFSSFMNGLTLKATVKEIKAGPVPAGSFSATKDFEEITFDQLLQMSGGGKR